MDGRRHEPQHVELVGDEAGIREKVASEAAVRVRKSSATHWTFSRPGMDYYAERISEPSVRARAANAKPRKRTSIAEALRRLKLKLF